jgi:hypothetical protein
MAKFDKFGTTVLWLKKTEVNIWGRNDEKHAVQHVSHYGLKVTQVNR